MKIYSLTAVAALSLGATLALANQETAPTDNGDGISTYDNDGPRYSVTPFQLVGMAYQGYFRDHGVPGYGRFCDKVNFRRITADTLTAVAVESGRLDPEYIDDRYLAAVRLQLRGLCYLGRR